MDEQRQRDLFATRLLIASEPDGNMARSGKDAVVVTPMQAKTLLGRIETVNAGMGGFTLMVPVAAIRQAGLEATWHKHFTPTMYRGALHYPVEDYMLSVNILSRLEVVAGTHYAEARALYEAHMPKEPEGRGR